MKFHADLLYRVSMQIYLEFRIHDLKLIIHQKNNPNAIFHNFQVNDDIS